MRTRIKRKGMFVDSTDMYGPILDKYDNLQVLHNPEDIVNEPEVVYMTRVEYERHVFVRKIHKFMRIWFPLPLQEEVSNRYRQFYKESIKLRHKAFIKRKALQEQGSSLVVA